VPYMEIDRLFGLPAHPLLVHLPVVMVPLAALVAVVFAVRPRWLDRFGWVLVAVAGAGALGALLAAGSGEALEGQLRADGERITPAIHEHAELGDTARTIAVVFFFVVLGVVLVRWYARRRAGSGDVLSLVRSTAGAVLAAVLLVACAGAAMYTMVKAGHQGAKVVWEDDSP